MKRADPFLNWIFSSSIESVAQRMTASKNSSKNWIMTFETKMNSQNVGRYLRWKCETSDRKFEKNRHSLLLIHPSNECSLIKFYELKSISPTPSAVSLRNPTKKNFAQLFSPSSSDSLPHPHHRQSKFVNKRNFSPPQKYFPVTFKQLAKKVKSTIVKSPQT